MSDTATIEYIEKYVPVGERLELEDVVEADHISVLDTTLIGDELRYRVAVIRYA